MVQATIGSKLSVRLAWCLTLMAAVSCGEPEVVLPETLWVQVLPAHGSAGIAADVQALIYFTHPVAHADTLSELIGMGCLGAPPCHEADNSTCPESTVAADVEYDAQAQVVRLTPAASLQGGTCYEVTVQKGIEAETSDVAPLPVQIFSSFSTRQ